MKARLYLWPFGFAALGSTLLAVAAGMAIGLPAFLAVLGIALLAAAVVEVFID